MLEHASTHGRDFGRVSLSLSRMSKGAYGGVYKAVYNTTGLVVALKVIDLDTPDDDISEIQKEVAILSTMRDAARHNITLYHGCYLNGHELWIAMDFASGGSIRTLMKSGPIEEKYIVLIVREVLVALSFLHRQGIIHRDVKAANVLLTQVGKIVLADFGVAAHLQTNNKRSTFIGTPLWMAPEVITDGKLYDTKADIWSLGVTLFEIATGNPPYFGMEPLRACALIPRSAPAKLDTAGPWSAPMREFLAMCLQVDPANRPTADELAKSKWIKAVSKGPAPLAPLRELIFRYRSWIQSGGQRTSLAGMDSLVREDTFDVEEDLWDFDPSTDDDESVEPLGDEPPRSLDAQAAISSVRPPKPSSNISRNHPLLRLFDAESNPYANPTQPTYINLPSGASSGDTVRPMISIPSFEEMDEMAEAKTTKFVELPSDLISPATVRANPFSWTTQQPAAQTSPYMPSSPRMRSQTPESEGPWGSSSNGFQTPTDSSFPDNVQGYPVVTSSPSLPAISSADRPFTSTRRRADTAPSFEYPPLGAGIPSPLPTPTHSNSTSVSSTSSYNPSSSSGGSSPSYQNTSFSSSVGGHSTSSPPFPQRPVGEAQDRERYQTERATSQARPQGGFPLQISTPMTEYSNGAGYATPPTSAPGPFDQDFDPSDSPTFSLITPTPVSHPPPNAFPFPAESRAPPQQPLPWPTGPPLRPLDYGKLVTPSDVHSELEKTIAELGKWLEVVDGGLARILKGTA
ncbi:hypothetical protein RQP46_006618 [Phenoliferia psychrophenolica]